MSKKKTAKTAKAQTFGRGGGTVRRPCYNINGDTKVDPATTEIKVTFSKPMQDGSWSWVQMSKETFPETTGKPHYLADKRTCVLPVKLTAGRTYVLWINSDKFHNFKDAQGQPAVPYLLVFETGR